ncbi:MAG: hypothetical protein AB1941_24170 [Gemmatimonadota bacterium]
MVLTRAEATALMAEPSGNSWLAAGLLYGSSPRLLGHKDVRTTMAEVCGVRWTLPDAVADAETDRALPVG